ncbi:hypothetical protein [Paenibacillus sp. IHBB 3054]|uniref:hypothetical protein n=1 Tax=Paenibacillus sp. IHBB 3054 TaxID=3425689 RepID=UPI003F668D9D
MPPFRERPEWLADAKRSIVEVDGGDHMYKLLKGATTLNENDLNNYELSFKLKTPPVIPESATFYIFDRLNPGGNRGRIGYRKYADGTSSWIFYNAAWGTVKQNALSAQDLLPDTVYNMKIIVKGSEISVYADGKLKPPICCGMPTISCKGWERKINYRMGFPGKGN